MKRVFALLLALNLLLCGCAAGTSINEPKALMELGEAKRAESVAVVTVTINPAFELYLDVNMCVSKIRCLNEDAVSALEAVQADVVGLDYYSAMLSVLEGYDENGNQTYNSNKNHE